MALWLYATLDGVGSARELARLCEQHHAYRWLCGGVGTNHHTLSDFRVSHADWLDGELSRGLASLMAAGEVSLDSVAHDGMRVRAAAGTVLAPSNQARNGAQAAYAPRPKDGPGVSAWRRNMREPNGKRWYEARSHAECVFAQWRERGLVQLLVRGASKVRCVVLLHVLAHNMLCGFRLRGQADLAPA